MSHSSRCSQHQAGFMFGKRPRKPVILNSWFLLWMWRQICDDLVSNTWVFCWSYSYFDGWITASYCVDILGNQVHPMVHMMFRNSDPIFQDDISPIHIARTLKSWFEEHEDAHVPWPAQSPVLYIIESLWSVWESRVRNRVPPPSSHKSN